MERHFLLPVTIATAAHAILLFSGSEVSPIAREKPTYQPLELRDPPPPLPDVSDYDTDSDSPPASGGPSLPTQPELPPSPNHPDSITITAGPVAPPNYPLIRTIDKIPGGINGGPGNGPGTGFPGGPIHLSALDNAPATRLQPAPNFPRELQDRGEPGTATVAFYVDPRGSVYNARLVEATHSLFGEEAMRAIKRWRFAPGLKNGLPVAFRMEQTFTFALHR